MSLCVCMCVCMRIYIFSFIQVRFRIIQRDTMEEYTNYIYLTSAFFFLHAINAYEDRNHLIIDICCYENADMLGCMTIEALQVKFLTKDLQKHSIIDDDDCRLRMLNIILTI
jgi:carotenoid cleavage dioxygenase-like enzyme